MRTRLVVALCAAVIAVPVAAQSTQTAQTAQTGTIAGSVTRDSTNTPVGQAQVQLPQLNRTVTTDRLGAFQFSDVPAGRYAIVIRAVGFQPLFDSLDVTAGDRIDADAALTPDPVSLAAQRTTARAAGAQLSPGLQEMAERMKTHAGGYFITDSTLRANNERKLTALLTKLPNISQERATAGSSGLFLASGRADQPGDGGPIFEARVDSSSFHTFPPGKCYVNVFVDGAKYFIGPATENNPPPDFGALSASDYSGIEYYPGGATVPAEYNVTTTSCGTVLLWTRHTP